MNLWTLAIRETEKRPGRTLLTLLGITLGLATVVATQLTVQTIHRAYRDLFEGVGGPPALEVTALGQDGFSADLALTLTGNPAIKELVPQIRGALAVSAKSGGVTVPVLGIDPNQMAAWPLREGHVARARDEVLLDSSLAQALGVKAGDTLSLWALSGPAKVRLAGVLKPRGTGVGKLVLPLASAQHMFELEGKVTGIRVVLVKEGDSTAVQAEIARRLPEGLTVQGPGQRGQMAQNSLFATEQGLSYLSLVALVAAAFVILNTFMLNVGERRPQLAVLRTLGATRLQVLGFLLHETLLLGIAGTVAGWTAGIGLAYGLLHIMARFSGLALPALQWTLGPFLLTLVLGPGMALAAAFFPAWLASRRQPLDELRPQHTGSCSRPPLRICLAGLTMLALGAAMEAAVCLHWFSGPVAAAVQGPVLAFILGGGVLTLPLLVLPFLRFLETLPLGLERHLALNLLARHPCRTGLTAGVLFLALAVAIGFGHSIQGIVSDLRRWTGQTVVADYLVRASMPDTSFSLAVELPEKLGRDMARLSGVAVVENLSFIPAVVNDQEVLLLARTLSPGQPLPLDLHEGNAPEVEEGLRRGQAVLGTSLAQVLGVQSGDSVVVQTSHGPKEVRVAGTAHEYAAGGMTICLEWHTARSLLGVAGVHCFLVSARPGAVEDAGAALQAFSSQHSLLLQSNADMRAMVDNLLQRVITLLWALMVLAFLVASLGVVNTLTMNVQEQRRDLGILRALGVQRRQIGKLILAQALLLGCLGLLPGALAGGALAFVINLNCDSWGGHAIPFQPDMLVIAGCWGLTLVTALIAALFPAWKAARMPVIQTLQ
jgi:putative ABC transport system permease protein